MKAKSSAFPQESHRILNRWEQPKAEDNDRVVECLGESKSTNEFTERERRIAGIIALICIVALIVLQIFSKR